MNKFNIAILILFLACADTSKDSGKRVSSQIENPIFSEMFNEYQGIIDEYEAIMSSLDSDDFSRISDVGLITKRASLWIDKWEKEIKKGRESQLKLERKRKPGTTASKKGADSRNTLDGCLQAGS